MEKTLAMRRTTRSTRPACYEQYIGEIRNKLFVSERGSIFRLSTFLQFADDLPSELQIVRKPLGPVYTQLYFSKSSKLSNVPTTNQWWHTLQKFGIWKVRQEPSIHTHVANQHTILRRCVIRSGCICSTAWKSSVITSRPIFQSVQN